MHACPHQFLKVFNSLLPREVVEFTHLVIIALHMQLGITQGEDIPVNIILRGAGVYNCCNNQRRGGQIDVDDDEEDWECQGYCLDLPIRGQQRISDRE